jgi:acid phosphatase family membrane protein YuiD
MTVMHLLLSTYIFLIPLVVLVLTEICKLFVHYVREGNWEERIFHPGGFPSSHSAFVTSLLLIVGKRQGVDSTDFAIAFVLACIVWYDAVSVRRQLGQQAQILNRLQHWEHLKERLGHSFVEVLGGIGFGALVTAIGIALSK